MEEDIWEAQDDMKKRYPHLLESKGSVDQHTNSFNSTPYIMSGHAVVLAFSCWVFEINGCILHTYPSMFNLIRGRMFPRERCCKIS